MILEISKYKYTKKEANKKILDAYREWFLVHPERWIKSEQLERVVGFGSSRTFVNKLRCEGLSIISNVKFGYKYTNNKDEIKKCYDDLRMRALRQLTAAAKMKRFL